MTFVCDKKNEYVTDMTYIVYINVNIYMAYILLDADIYILFFFFKKIEPYYILGDLKKQSSERTSLFILTKYQLSKFIKF